MNRLEHYRVIDLVFFSLLGVGASILSRYLNVTYAGAGFYISFSWLICYLSLYRWQNLGLVSLGIVTCIDAVSFGNHQLKTLFVYLSAFIITVFIHQMFKISFDKLQYDKNAIYLSFTLFMFCTLLIRGIMIGLSTGETVISITLTFLQGLLSYVISLGVLGLLKRQGSLFVNFDNILTTKREEFQDGKSEYREKKESQLLHERDQ